MPYFGADMINQLDQSSELTTLVINVGGFRFTAKLDKGRLNNFYQMVIPNHEDWLTILEPRPNVSVALLRPSSIDSIEFVKEPAPITTSAETIPIKRLADFAKVNPITINRLFPHTLYQTGKGKRKFSRATKETALELRLHLLKKHGKAPSEREFLSLFEGVDDDVL